MSPPSDDRPPVQHSEIVLRADDPSGPLPEVGHCHGVPPFGMVSRSPPAVVIGNIFVRDAYAFPLLTLIDGVAGPSLPGIHRALESELGADAHPYSEARGGIIDKNYLTVWGWVRRARDGTAVGISARDLAHVGNDWCDEGQLDAQMRSVPIRCARCPFGPILFSYSMLASTAIEYASSWVS